jgi:glycosyltransferase involved in cell wall biosynthesis
MRIVVVSNQFPLPLDSGEPMRVHGLTTALARDHDVHVLALTRETTTDAVVAEMQQATGGPVEAFDASPQGGPARRWTRAVASRTPPYVLAQHSEPLARRLAALAPSSDAVALLDDYAGGYARVTGGTPVVLDKHNVLAYSLAEAGPAEPSARSRTVHHLSTGLMRQFEARTVRAARSVVVTSREESTRLEELYGVSADAVVPSGVDVPLRPATPSRDRAVAWLGLHAYEPNVEGLERFVEQGWDVLGRDGWRLLVAGSNPPERVRALERFPGVELVGFVDDLDDLYARCCAAVVPLWSGAGVKLKTLTFMAAGVPTAATPVALEGIEATDGRDCLVADTPEGLADALCRIGEDARLAGGLAEAGRALVARSYSWEGVAPAFVRAVEEAA